MKAATGELNLTLITIIAIGLIGTLFYTVLWPNIRDGIQSQSDQQLNPDISYVEVYNTNLYN